MKKYKKFALTFLSFICVIVFAILTEILFFNGIKINEFENNKGIISLEQYTSIENETIIQEKVPQDESSIFDSIDKNNDIEEQNVDILINNELEEAKKENIEYEEVHILKFKIEFPKMFIDRIKIDYSTSNDINITFKYETFDEYGNPISDSKTLSFLKEFNTLTQLISEDVDSIEFTISDEQYNDIKITSFDVINEFCFNIYRFIFLIIFYLLIDLIIILRKIIFKKIELLFAISAFLFGLCQIILIPCLTLYSWDDQVHLEKMYSLLDYGKVETSISYDYSHDLRFKMGYIPSSYEEINMLNNYLNENSNRPGEGIVNDNKYISYDNYSYIPSALIIKLCKMIHLPYTLIFYSGKIINLLFYISIMYYAIKKAKVGKNLLFVLSLLPSTIFLAAQYSRDAVITAGLYLGISTFLNCYCTDEKMDLKNLLIFILSIVFASTSKAIYAPILLLILIMPKSKFRNHKSTIITKISIVILLAILLSTFVLPTVSTTTLSSSVGDIRGGDTSSGSQIKLIMSQPVSFAKVFVKYLKDTAAPQILYNQTFGRWHNLAVISSLRYYALLFMTLFCTISSKKSKKIIIDKKLKITLLVLSAFIICLICGSMYLSYTPVASTTVLGVQPRYYIPLLFGIFMCFSQTKIKHEFNEEKIIKSFIIIYIYIYFFEICESILPLCS